MKLAGTHGFPFESSALAVFVIALATLTLAPAAQAGVVDSPLPAIGAGESTKHVFTVPGVLNSTQLATMFQCTSLDTDPLNIAVEVFAGAGGGSLNSAVGGTIVLGVGQTVAFSTQHVFSLPGEDVDLGLSTTNIRGSARILSTSKKLGCTAYTISPAANPGYMNFLPVLKGKKQSGL